MKVINYLIILLSLLCHAGCKFDGSLRYEQYDLDASKANKVSFDIPWARIEEKVPLIEWVKIVPDESSLYIKLKGNMPRKYTYSEYFDNSDKKKWDSWSGYESATNDRISGVSFGITWTSYDVEELMSLTDYSDDDIDKAQKRLFDARAAQYANGNNTSFSLNSYDYYREPEYNLETLNAEMELKQIIKEKAKNMLPMLNNILTYYQYGSEPNNEKYFTTEYPTMLIHIDTDSEYDGWYLFPIKEHNTYWNPQFPPEKKSYF